MRESEVFIYGKSLVSVIEDVAVTGTGHESVLEIFDNFSRGQFLPYPPQSDKTDDGTCPEAQPGLSSGYLLWNPPQ